MDKKSEERRLKERGKDHEDGRMEQERKEKDQERKEEKKTERIGDYGRVSSDDKKRVCPRLKHEHIFISLYLNDKKQ